MGPFGSKWKGESVTDGKNKFWAAVTVADIARITDRVPMTSAHDLTNIMDYDDLQTALVIRALIEYLEEQKCEVGFYLDINETSKK